MPTEREKMLAGSLYDPLDPELVAGRQRARDLCAALNATRERDQPERRRILTALFGAGSVVMRDVPEAYSLPGIPAAWFAKSRTHRRARLIRGPGVSQAGRSR